MSNKIESEKKPDGSAPGTVAKTEYTFKFACETPENGKRRCVISEILTNNTSVKPPVTESSPTNALPEGVSTDTKASDLCQILSDACTEKDDTDTSPAVQGRRHENRPQEAPEPTAPRRHERGSSTDRPASTAPRRFEDRPRDAPASRQGRTSDRRRDRVAE